MSKQLVFIISLLIFGGFATNNVNALEMSDRLSGKILLQVEENGEAWYVNPSDKMKYYLGRPTDAFNIMRALSLGISNRDFDSLNTQAPERLSGRILLKVEDSGKAYYVDTIKRQMHYLGRPSDAFSVMRNLGLGISNIDLNRIGSADSLQVLGQQRTKTLIARPKPLNVYSPTNPVSPIISNPTTPPANNTNNPLASLEKQAFDAINDYRVSKGLSKLAWNETIAEVAREHSDNMATKKVAFSHDGFANRIDTIKSTISLKSAAENVAYNSGYADPVKNAVTGWLNSPGHKTNIIGDYTTSGLGIKQSTSGAYYFTQIFIK